jgi:hypothetical protein
MRYTLKDDGFAWKNIYAGRKKVGRVYRNAAGLFCGVITGGHTSEARTERDAFHEVAAQALGFNTAADLDANNAAARQARAARKRRAQAIAHDYINAPTIEAKFAVLDRIFKR